MSKNTGNSAANSGGIGFVGLLTIVFIVLKLIGKITWSWIWVLSPIWITTLLVIAMFLIVFLVLWIKNKPIKCKRTNK